MTFPSSFFSAVVVTVISVASLGLMNVSAAALPHDVSTRDIGHDEVLVKRTPCGGACGGWTGCGGCGIWGRPGWGNWGWNGVSGCGGCGGCGVCGGIARPFWR
ncbi:hypothetical protein GGI07_000809 [Coemansia sp. Benny D115]|nr:hypothetical protein GGI07_000809 [Coemansia sp. Benny D115]